MLQYLYTNLFIYWFIYFFMIICKGGLNKKQGGTTMPNTKDIISSAARREAFTTSINSDLKRKFKVYCASHGRKLNEVLEELLIKLLDKDGGDNGDTN
mgnify:FL=1